MKNVFSFTAALSGGGGGGGNNNGGKQGPSLFITRAEQEVGGKKPVHLKMESVRMPKALKCDGYRRTNYPIRTPIGAVGSPEVFA